MFAVLLVGASCSRAPEAPSASMAASSGAPATRAPTRSGAIVAATRAGHETARAASVPSTPSADAGAATPAPSAGTPCGGLGCTLYASPAEAFERALAERPLVLGVGEAHPLRGTERIEPAVRRFTRDFLPLLRGRASDLVVELLLPNAACETASTHARKQQRVVTEHQATSDQSDFVALGTAARAIGIRAHALEPTCDDLKRISAGGADVVETSLEIVTRLSRDALTRYFEANFLAKDPRMVVGYGGAMHNDVAPRPGREAWSFGPAMTKLTRGRYVELDLIVPEFIEDTTAWRSFPWFSAFDPKAHPHETTLFESSPGAFALVFSAQASP